MKTDKPFKTIDEQIKILKKRNLVFLNEETAKNALSRYTMKLLMAIKTIF